MKDIYKMHIDFERFISSILNWPIERTGWHYNDKNTAGAWEVYKFAKVTQRKVNPAERTK